MGSAWVAFNFIILDQITHVDNDSKHKWGDIILLIPVCTAAYCCRQYASDAEWRIEWRDVSSLQPALYWHFWRRQGVFKRLWWLFMLQSCQSLNSINSINTKLCLGVIAKIGNQKLQIHFYKFPSSQCRTQSSWRPPATCTWPQLMQLLHRCFSNTDAISIKCFHLIMSFI